MDQELTSPVQAPTTENAQTDLPVAPKPAPEDAFKKNFAAMRRKEQAIAARQREIEAREKALQAKETEYQTKFIPKDAISENPIGLLMQNGFTAEQLAGMLLSQNDPKSPEIMQIRSELRKLAEAQEKAQAAAAEAEKRSYERARESIAKSVVRLTSNNEEYETINAMEAHDSVVELMEKTLEEDGYLMSEEEAAKEVENYLREKAYAFTKLKSIQARLKPTESPTTQSEPTKQSNLEKLQGMTTLSNRQSATGATPLTAKERRERAILAAMGKLQ